MTGVITLRDEGQDYIEFEVACSVIQKVRPSLLPGWYGTKLLNTKFVVGDYLQCDLQWRDFNPTLNQAIISIHYEDIERGEWLRANMSKERKLYADPRGGKDRMLYDVDCNGVPFYFACLNYAAVAASESLLNLEKIPDVLLEDVDGVMLFDDIKPGSPETVADIGHGFMVIYNNYIVDYGIITHEATHAWAFDKWGQYAPPMDTAYVEVIRFSGEEAITEYAKTNYSEDFAEGVRYYVFDPTWMKEKCPLRYDIIKMLMESPDFYG